MRTVLIAFVIVLTAVGQPAAQQVADTTFVPEIAAPAYSEGEGPVVLIDEAHHNFHTASGRYFAFARLLGRDGYVVRPSDQRFTAAVLGAADILVISNALAEQNVEDWSLPNPSAFDDDEILAVREWVRDGGSLFLIADHMPMPGAAEKLAAVFGLYFNNGFAVDTAQDGGALIFRRSDGSLVDHAILNGRGPDERIDSVASFTGQAFRAVPSAEPLMLLPNTVVLLMPVEAWEFSDQTPRLSAAGMLQGAVLRYGEGRVAAFGEAAMFTSQMSGDESFGMSLPVAAHNARFLINIMHWLSGLLGD
jgi:hypothetical protein